MSQSTRSEPFAAPEARDSPAPQKAAPVRDGNGVGNLTIARHVDRGARDAAFPGVPIDNQAAQARAQRKCDKCEGEARRLGVRAKCATCAEKAANLDNARSAVAGASQPLPHLDRIQASFGRHDLSDVRTLTGGVARAANKRIGANAFTAGNRIGFRDAPDEWLAAHESAHVIQQRDGASALGNGGDDPWERHADEVADAVASGRSAEPLLDEVTRGGGARTPAVQLDEYAGVADAGYGDYAPDAAIVDAGVPEIAGTPPQEGTVNLGGVITLHPEPELLREELMQYTIEHGAGGLQQAKDMLDEQAGLAKNNPDYYDGNANYGYNSAKRVLDVQANAAPIFEFMFALVAEIRATFEAQAYHNAEGILDANEKQARGEALRYGISQDVHYIPLATETDFENEDHWYNMPESPEQGGEYYEGAKLAAAAKILLERRVAIDDKVSEMWDRFGDYEAWHSELQQMRDDYDRLRSVISSRFPILAAFNDQDDLRTIASGPTSHAAHLLGSEIRTKLRNITTVRANLYDAGKVNIWRLENLVAVTLVQLGWDADPLKKIIIEETVRRSQPGIFEELALLVFNIGALLLAGVTAGISLVVAAGVNAYVASQHVEDYLMQKALSGTAFDKAQALTADEPSLFWLAVEIIFAIVDIVGAVKALRVLTPLVKTAKAASAGEKAVQALEAARIAARKEGGELLAARVEDGIRAARQGRDIEMELAGATAKEIDELAAAGRLVDDTSLADDVGEAIVTPLGGKVRVSKHGDVWICSSPCEQLRAKYADTFANDPEMLTELERIEDSARRAAAELDDAKQAGDATQIKQAEDNVARVKQQVADLEGALLVKHPELQGIEGTAETVQAMRQVEAEAQVTKGRLDPHKMDAPPPEKPAKLAPEDEELWEQYDSYYSGRYDALQGKLPPGAEKVKPPLSWNAYRDFLGKFRRGTSYQRGVQEGLEAEAELRRMGIPSEDAHLGIEDPIFGTMQRPVVEPRGNVGIAGKEISDPTVKYADQLIYDESTLHTQNPVVVSVSNKSREFPKGKLNQSATQSIRDQVEADAIEAIEKYGGTINIRRANNPLFGKPVEVSKVVLIYDARYTLEVEAVIRKTIEDLADRGTTVTVVFR